MAERLVGTEHPWYAHALVGLAGVESRTGNSQGALEHAMRAADIVSRYPGSPMGPPSELVLARALHGTARYAQALERYRGALRAHEHVNPDHPMRARILVGMAEVHLELGDIMAATPLLEDALAIQRRHHRPTREIARTQLILARALPRK
jgi:hypothetical protein